MFDFVFTMICILYFGTGIGIAIALGMEIKRQNRDLRNSQMNHAIKMKVGGKHGRQGLQKL